MSKNIFKLSFDDSTKIAPDRKFIKDFTTFDSTEKVTWRNSNNSFILRLIFFLIGAGFVFGIFAGGIVFNAHSAAQHPIQTVNMANAQIAINIANIIRPVLSILMVVLLILNLIQLFPTFNFAWMRFLSTPFIIVFSLFVMLAAIPMGSALMLQHWGKISSIIAIVFIIFFLIFYPVNHIYRIRCLLTGKGNYVKFRPIFKVVIAVWIICLLIAFATNYDGFSNLMAGSLLFGIEIGLCICFNELLNLELTYYYMIKYSKQYRVYYRIRDDAWWMSTRKANKHEHVYSMPDKK